MRKIDALLETYGESHQTDLNKKIHYFCVPAIFFSLLGLLYSIPVYQLFTSIINPGIAKHINLATGLIIFGTLYYLSLSIRLAVSMLFFSLLALAIIHIIELSQVAPVWLVMIAIFIVAWIGQFIGHHHEGKKPSFIEDLQYLMIGPAWTLSHLFDRFGIRF